MNDAAVFLCLVMVCVGCESPQPKTSATPERETHAAPETARPSPPAPFEHAVDTEYQNGLASLLAMSPVLGPKLITSAYRIGYMTGLEEADHFQFFTDGDTGAVGCLHGFAAVRDYFPPLDEASASDRAKVEQFRDICANKRPKVGIQGALFSEGRLKEAQWAGEHIEDAREIKGLITIYVVGYNMGFAHEWEAVDQEAHVEQVARERCEQVVQKIQPPLSPVQLAAASSKCVEGARATREHFGHGYKCLLAGIQGEMNSDLSGLASKPGCPHK